ncbi:MAG: LacI family DNA-binding transcriptional regulator [Nocardioidaceae bacterium]|nr:LacI family DNA-binding transcriptional regulator [Nocardioidaceae bacterium]
MADVALLAQVSHQTVSRVLNGSPGIRPGTRDRVLMAIDELGYRRNVAARILASKRSGNIGVITSGGGQFGPTSVALSLEAAAHASGYSLSLVTLSEITERSLRAAADRLLEQSVEALVVIVSHRAALPFTKSFDVGIPVVLVEGDLSATPLTAGVDQVQGARLATRHLLDLGHDTVYHIAGPPDWIEAMVRRDAWREELKQARRRVPPLRWGGDWSARSGYEAGRVLSREPGVTAVFAANDQMALGLIRALNEAGRRVPEDVSVVGFDDLPESPFFSPPLTTIRQDFPELGRRAMALIQRLLKGDAHASVPLVEAVLIIRESTAPPPFHN